MKYIINLVIFVAFLAIAYFGLAFAGLLPLQFNLLKMGGPNYLETPIKVEEVKAIAKLFSQQYSNEIVVHKIHTRPGIFSNYKDKLILIAEGKSYAGTDLSKMKQEDIKIIDSVSCEIIIPKAEILETIINPSGFRVFIEEGYWKTNYDAVQKVKKEAVDSLEQMAKSKDILAKADEKSVKMMKNFMQSLGYKNVNVILK